MRRVQTCFLCVVFWLFYQFYALSSSFVFDEFLFIIGTPFAMMMAFGSLYSVIYTRPPPVPAKYRISEGTRLDFSDLMTMEGLRQRMIESSGANKFHAGKICAVCRSLKPERTSHCSACDRCVPRMDHHCYVLGTCVHYKNHKQFILLFFWVVVTSFIYATVSFPYYTKASVELGGFKSSWVFVDHLVSCIIRVIIKYTNVQHSTALKITIPFFAPFGMGLIFSFMLSVQFIYFPAQNLTFMDYLRSGKCTSNFPYLRTNEAGAGCYSHGSTIRNVQAFFGNNALLWIWPQFCNSLQGAFSYNCMCLKKSKEVVKQVAINIDF